MSRGAQIVDRAWTDPGCRGRLLRGALRPAAAAYSTAVRLRALLYRLRLRRGRRLPAAVISIGNLTVGGTGKTPTALWAAERLRERSRRVAIVSRGYGGSERGPTVVGADGGAAGARSTLDWRRVGEEPVLLARRFGGPVVAGRRRADAGHVAVRDLGAEVLVLDDGFQHLALARDFDLVLVRAGADRAPRLLPAGRFREPPSALARADAVLVTKGSKAAKLDPVFERRLAGRPCFRGNLVATGAVTPVASGWREVPLGVIAGRRAIALSGIADRESFYRILQEWDTHVDDFIEFPDHHPYCQEDWKAIALRSRGADLVVTTEKDLIKLDQFPFAKEKLVAVRVAMHVEDGEALVDLMERAIERRLGERGAEARR